MKNQRIIIVGAGPAGLSAALEVVRLGGRPLVLEQSVQVGGIARTEEAGGYLFDVGGHRYFTKSRAIRELWAEVIGDDFIDVPRLSRIYYGGRLFNYPLKPLNALANLGVFESLRVMASYARSHLRPLPCEETFEQWVVNRFGRRLFEIFFKTYTEKVWGMPCGQIRADWAAQRIKGLSLRVAVSNALFGKGGAKSLIDTFHYPRRGPGQMWQRFRERVEAAGGEVRLEAKVVAIETEAERVVAVRYRTASGEQFLLPADRVVSSMPLAELVGCLAPPPSAAVRAAAGRLKYRAFLMVVLVIDRPQVFPDQWIYIHSPEVKVGRIQNFKNWSAEMVPDASCTSLGLEYFCDEGDALWELSAAELTALASRELAVLALAPAARVLDSHVVRQPKAYPVYDENYRDCLELIRAELGQMGGLQTVGRNGMHRYNNMDHSMLTGMLAARNIMQPGHNLWQVNEDQEYHEQDSLPAEQRRRLAEQVLHSSVAPLDKVAFALACGVVGALGLLFVTLLPVLTGSQEMRPYLALLAYYLPGYRPTLAGAALAGGYGLLAGAVLGWLFAWLRNLVLAVSMAVLRLASADDA